MRLDAGICLHKSLKIPRQKRPDTYDKILADLRESSHTEAGQQLAAAAVKARVCLVYDTIWARAYSKRVPRTNCALRIKKCAPRISSGIILFLSTS